MKLLTTLILALLVTTGSASAEPNYSKVFTGVEPCFIFYDLNKGETVQSFGASQCKKQISPCSTFKIPLSLIGYDSGILKDQDNPKWEASPETIAKLNASVQADPTFKAIAERHAQDQTPKTWMARSVVWYSQILTQKLGMPKFKNYVAKLAYGNQDLSGNPGKNDGLTQSWLSSSLKISAEEQQVFLKKLITHKLQITKSAIKNTEDILFIEELANGWKLYGKTGSGAVNNADSSANGDLNIGWFVGWLEKSGQTYIFVINIQDTQKSTEYGGPRAKRMAKEIFATLDVLQNISSVDKT